MKTHNRVEQGNLGENMENLKSTTKAHRKIGTP